MIEEKLINDKNVPEIDIIINFLKETSKTDEQLKNGILNEDKNLNACWEYVRERAKSQAKDGTAMIEDATVYGWVTHYFTEDEDTLCKDLGKATKAEREEQARVSKEKEEKAKLERASKKTANNDDEDDFEEDEEEEIAETEEEKNKKIEANKKAKEEKELKEKGFIPISIFDLED